MTDRLTPAARSAHMARIRSSGTRPERELAAAARRAFPGRAIVRNDRRLPGAPDVYVPSLRLAVFADGCLWHACPRHFRVPRTRPGFWLAKARRNAARDRRVDRALRASGAAVWRVWEHDLRTPAAADSALARRRRGRVSA